MHHLHLINNENAPKSFQYVNAALKKVLGCQPIQAEQCCLIAKENGKAHIKQGEIMELLSLKTELEEMGLTIELTETEL